MTNKNIFQPYRKFFDESPVNLQTKCHYVSFQLWLAKGHRLGPKLIFAYEILHLAPLAYHVLRLTVIF